MPTRSIPSLPMIEAGQLRQRIQLQTSSYTQNETGDLVTTWTTTASLWAQVRPLQLASSRSARTTEPFAGQELQPQDVVLIVIRYPGSLNIVPEMRVVFGSHTYIVRSVINVAERNHEVNIVGQEMLEDGSINA